MTTTHTNKEKITWLLKLKCTFELQNCNITFKKSKFKIQMIYKLNKQFDKILYDHSAGIYLRNAMNQ